MTPGQRSAAALVAATVVNLPFAMLGAPVLGWSIAAFGVRPTLAGRPF